jgi:hypothetical protein
MSIFWASVTKLADFIDRHYLSATESYQINDLDDLSEDIGKFHPIG